LCISQGFTFLPAQTFIDVKIEQLNYESPELTPLRKWLDEKWMKETPIDSKLELSLFMDKSKDAQLLEDLVPFELPPFHWINIDRLSKGVRRVKHFLTYSLGQIKILYLNYESALLDGSEWMDAILNALPKVKEAAGLWNFSFSKEQVEALVDNSLHLERLRLIQCKWRKRSN
jgi:hypothetical protein